MYAIYVTDNHIADLKRIFNIMQAHQLKINPTKFFLGVASGKFLKFVVTSKGIHLDLRKSVPFRKCNFQETSKNLEDCRDVWPISKGS